MEHPRSGKRGEILFSAATFGLVTGLLEGVGLLGLQESGLATWEWIRDGVGAPILWISPAFELLLFLAASIPWLILSSFSRRSLLPVASGFFVWMGSYPLLAATGRLSDFACAVLGLGAAVQVGCWLERAGERGARCLRGLFPVVAAAALCVSAGAAGYGWLKESVLEPREYADLPAPPAGAPNVVLVVMDTVRADHLSAYGYHRPTSPVFSRLAQNALLFTAAYSTSSWSLPAHASLMTGLYPYEHKADPYPLRPEFTTLAEFLSSRGYATSSFVGNTIWCTHASGLAQGFVHHEDYFGNLPDMISRTAYSQKSMEPFLEAFRIYRPVARKRAEEISRSALRWIDRRPSRPFFLFINYFDAHEPVFPPRPYDSMFEPPPR